MREIRQSAAAPLPKTRSPKQKQETGNKMQNDAEGIRNREKQHTGKKEETARLASGRGFDDDAKLV